MTEVAQHAGQIGTPIIVDDDDDNSMIDEDQLNEYREDVQRLGNFPVSRYAYSLSLYSFLAFTDLRAVLFHHKHNRTRSKSIACP